ncbi:DEAD/DEAH box helicase [Xylariaceae sp. FL1272]|nr:DEAD/DEAH box helicase [Xylariaceae sp. FL1272]
MADGGLLLNFDVSDQPAVKRQVKYTGGTWRDRSRAKKNARNGGLSTGSNATPLPTVRRDREQSTADSVDAERPAKRQRTQHESHHHRPDLSSRSLSYKTGKLPPGSISTGPKNALHGTNPDGITSRLFTKNPTPHTVFEDPVEEAEPAKPSNAPLSDEAENFHALGLSRRLAQHLSAKLELKAPTSIQKSTIPQLSKEDNDAFLQAQTGSGKTLAYLLPIVQRIMAMSHDEDGTSTGTKVHRSSGLFAIILAPTRELCKQIATVLEKVLRCAPWIVSTSVIGGESKKSEKARIRKGVNILIATPGRLADHLDNTEVLDVGTVRWLVLDEGDRLMEMGFEEELKSIVGKIRKEGLNNTSQDGVKLDKLPQRRVTVLCSATMKMNVQKLGEISLQDAVHITGSPSEKEGGETAEINEAVFAAPSQLKQSYIITPAKLRLVTLVALLKSSFARKGSVMKAIIFISCADSVDFHFDLLRSGISRSAWAENTTVSVNTVADMAYVTSPANPTVSLVKLHGSLPQPVRTATLKAFREEKNPCVLVTTDIASRGLDVPAVDLVIEYDPAFSVDDHTHRIGRTARAGRPGRAVLFVQPGCEEGYIGLLNSASSVAPQSYEPTLQKGFFTPVTLPKEDKDTEAPTLVSEKQSPNSRAEALQLHFEQRLLASDKEESKSKLLDAARQAFRSHIRAYATHVRDERQFFDITQLHLGHTAKSYGLREAPGGIGGGPSRRTYKAGQNKHGGEQGRSGAQDDEKKSKRLDDADIAAVDDDAAKRMRMKMKSVMNASSEFNIG